MYITEKDWVLEPFVKVGVFPLGKQVTLDFITRYLNTETAKKNNKNEYTRFDVLGEDAYVLISHDYTLENVSCWEKCLYEGVNLIGKTLQEAEDLLGYKARNPYPEIASENFDIDEIGVQLWLGDDGLIRSVDCGMYIDPDEV